MPKKNSTPELTVTKATTQARRHVDRLMPGVMATVESRLSHDLDTDTPLVVTIATFPATYSPVALADALKALPGAASVRAHATRIVLTRAR